MGNGAQEGFRHDHGCKHSGAYLAPASDLGWAVQKWAGIAQPHRLCMLCFLEICGMLVFVGGKGGECGLDKMSSSTRIDSRLRHWYPVR
jgi:hypothetical protein